jgi:hypothetical protein
MREEKGEKNNIKKYKNKKSGPGEVVLVLLQVVQYL